MSLQGITEFKLILWQSRNNLVGMIVDLRTISDKVSAPSSVRNVSINVINSSKKFFNALLLHCYIYANNLKTSIQFL